MLSSFRKSYLHFIRNEEGNKRITAIKSTISLISRVLSLIVGILGIRDAKNPSKIGPFKGLATFALAYGVFSLVLELFNMGGAGTLTAENAVSTILSSAISIVFMAVCVWLACKTSATALPTGDSYQQNDIER